MIRFTLKKYVHFRQPAPVLISGLPRSGSTLVCSLLSSLPDVVALNEPMKLGMFQNFDEKQIVTSIRNFAKDSRKSLIQSGKAPSMQVDGKIPGNMFEDNFSDNGLRKVKASLDEIYFKKDLTPDFRLIVKHNSGFAALMDVLSKSFECYAIIRNPLALLASWNTVNIPVSKGFVPVIEMFDESFKKEIHEIPDVFDRQVFILNYLFRKFEKNLSPGKIIRYEEIIESKGKCLKTITFQAGVLDFNLENKNNNSVYRNNHLQSMGNRLMETDGAFWKYYTKNEVKALMNSF